MKGEMSLAFLGGAILMVTFILGVIAINVGIQGTYNDYSERATCQYQIEAHAKVNAITNEAKQLNIACPTRRLELEKPSNLEAQKVIAKELRDCWDLWGRGKYKLFGTNEGKYCHVCSTINFDDMQTVEGLPGYLADNNHLAYIAGEQVGEQTKTAEIKKHADDNMDVSQGLGIIFYNFKDTDFLEKGIIYTAGNPGVGGMAGGLTGIIVGLAIFGTGGTVLIPVATVTIGGTVAGGITALKLRPDISHYSVVVARPLNPDSIENLDCTVAPVHNE